MENVPDLAGKSIFQSFVSELERLQYKVHYRSVFCPPLGIPQQRRRLVLLASLLGDVAVPEGCRSEKNYRTVRQTIASLPRLKAGGADSKDPLHRARSASSLNLRRLQASKPGGTWRDWDKDLRAPCHRKKTGASYQSVYSRMTWDKPAPTITTLAHSFGSGRFGHPEQDRSISLREAALLQTFPRQYRFVRPRDEVFFFGVGRLIGNAVPPKLAFYIGKELLRTVTNLEEAPAP